CSGTSSPKRLATSSVEAEHDLPDAVRARRRRASDRDEAALLQHPDRGDVVLGDVRGERTLLQDSDELPQRLGRDAPAPELLPEPIADEAFTLVDPAADVARDISVRDDRAPDRGVVGLEPLPMRRERLLVTRWERRHLVSLRLPLVLEEDRAVGLLRLAECDLHIPCR